jgi:hypothetical protein
MNQNRRNNKKAAIGPVVLFVLAGVALIHAMTGSSGMSFAPADLYHKLVVPLARLLVLLSIGLLVGQVVESRGWAGKLAVLARPLMRWGRLGDESGAAFTTAFVSSTAANTMLMSFHQDGKLSLRDLKMSYLVSTGLPVFLLHLPTTFFIIVPLTRSAGLIYLGITFLAACLRSFGLLLVARLTHPRAESENAAAEPPSSATLNGTSTIWAKFRRRLSRIVLYVIPIYVLIFVLNGQGLFEWARQAVAGWVSVEFIPVEAASVVVFAIATEFTSGVAAAGALLDTGALTVQQTVLALLLGSIAATPIRAMRHQLPSHVGIFQPRLGMELLITSQALRIGALVAVALPYLLWG